jgi:hypothetical protein
VLLCKKVNSSREAQEYVLFSNKTKLKWQAEMLSRRWALVCSLLFFVLEVVPGACEYGFRAGLAWFQVSITGQDCADML